MYVFQNIRVKVDQNIPKWFRWKIMREFQRWLKKTAWQFHSFYQVNCKMCKVTNIFRNISLPCIWRIMSFVICRKKTKQTNRKHKQNSILAIGNTRTGFWSVHLTTIIINQPIMYFVGMSLILHSLHIWC